MLRVVIILGVILVATPLEARRHHRHYGYYWVSHHHPRPGRITAVTTEEVYGPPQPVLTIVRTIVNGHLVRPWSGPPPVWAGDLHISPMISGRSVSRGIRQ